MKKRYYRIERLKAVEREYAVAILALEELRKASQLNAALLIDRDLQNRDAASFANNLEPTYVIRLFAEFESALRDVWVNGFAEKANLQLAH